MTDWWANINERGSKPDRDHFAAMAKAQNDVYMVCADSSNHKDTLADELAAGTLTRGELQRNAVNILNFLMKTNAMKRLMGQANEIEIIGRPEEDSDSDENVVWYDMDTELTIGLDGMESVKGQHHSFALKVSSPGWYDITITASSESGELAQIPVTLFLMGTASGTFTWNGTGGKPVSITKEAPLFSHFTAARLYFAQNGLKLHSISFKLNRPADINAAFVSEE